MSRGLQITEGDGPQDREEGTSLASDEAAYVAGDGSPASPQPKPDPSPNLVPDKDLEAAIKKHDEANRPMITSTVGALTNIIKAPAFMLKIFVGSTLSNMFKNISGTFDTMYKGGVSGFLIGLLMIVKEIFSAVIYNFNEKDADGKGKGAPSLLSLLVRMLVGGLPKMQQADDRMVVQYEEGNEKVETPGIFKGFYEAFVSSKAASAAAQNNSVPAEVNTAPEGAAPAPPAQAPAQSPITANKTAPSAPVHYDQVEGHPHQSSTKEPSAPYAYPMNGAAPSNISSILTTGPAASHAAAQESRAAAASAHGIS
jgi:hypothetical protein